MANRDAKKSAAEEPTKLPQITGSMFYQYVTCPHWLYFELFGDPELKAKRAKFAEMLLEMGVLYEKEVIGGQQLTEVKGRGNAVRFKATKKLMEEGVERIYHGLLIGELDGIRLIGEPDILEKRADLSSDIGAYYYVPVDIKAAEKLSDAHKLQLSLYGELLRQVQGVRPVIGYIHNGSGALLGFELRDFEVRFRDAIKDIRAILAGKVPPPYLSSGCKQSPWFAACKKLCEDADDIALLYNLKRKTMDAMRTAGIKTVHDAAGMFPETLADDDSSSLSLATLERHKLQARALIEKKHFVRTPIDLPEAPLEIFFDIEGDPLRQVEYLFGFLIRQDGGAERYEYFLAEKPEDEVKMWLAFLDWLATLEGDYVVYHYGTYEVSRIATLEGRYGGSSHLERFRDNMVDLNSVVKDSIVFPLYFYGIKDIGTYIGFERSKAISGGGESVAFYERWLAEQKKKDLEAIIKYNEDDVVATRYLKDWLKREKDEDKKTAGV